MNTPPVVSADEWREAREELLVKEKAHTRARDALAAERRRMPWTLVDKGYEFEGPEGKVDLTGLFGGKKQLVIYRFFFDPDVDGYPEKGCQGCSMVADQVAHPAHLEARDTRLVFVSRAKPDEIAQLKERMGWELIPWYSLTDDFDSDHDVGEWHGTNAFIQEDGSIYRTYLVDRRGDEVMGGTWAYLDITALGRQEKWEDSPEGYPQGETYSWWRRHDEYEEPGA